MAFKFLTLRQIEPYEALARDREVSKVARGPGGFLPAYKRADGEPERLSDDWRAKREAFIARHVAQLEDDAGGLYEDGEPTNRHLALIMWAYSPDASNLRSSMGSTYRRRVRGGMRAPRVCDMSKRTIEGWFSYYNDPQEHDSYGTVFEYGAYARSVELHNSGRYRVKVNDAHGRSIGVVEEMREEPQGLWGRVRVEETPEGDLVLMKVCEGTYDGFSVEFGNPKVRALDVVSERTGKRVLSIHYAELYGVALLGDRSDMNARIVSVRSAGGSHMQCDCNKRGASLAAVLNTKISVMEDEGASRDDVLAEVAAAAGIEAEEVSSILAGDVLEPEASTLEAFAEVTGVTVDRLTEAIADDKADGERAASSYVDDEPEAEDTRAGQRAAEEMLDALDNISAQVRRLRDLVQAQASESIVEIVAEEVELDAGAERSARVRRAREAASKRGAAVNPVTGDVLDTSKLEQLADATSALEQAFTSFMAH